MRAHQETGAQFIVDRALGRLAPHAVLGGGVLDDMRMGKCSEIALAIMQLAQRHLAAAPTNKRFGAPCLILVPKDIIDTWVSEIEATFGPGVLVVAVFETERLAQVSMSRAVMREQLLERTDIIIASYSLLTSSQHFAAELLRTLRYRAVFCDEAHDYVSPDTHANSVLCGLLADSRWYVSGTPIQNSLAFLINVLYFMGVSRTDLDRIAGSDDALATLARQLTIRRTLTPVEPIPEEIIDFATPIERALYEDVRMQVLASVAHWRRRAPPRMTESGVALAPVDELRGIAALRKLCMSAHLIHALFDPERPMLTVPPGMLMDLPASGDDDDDDNDNMNVDDSTNNDPMDISDAGGGGGDGVDTFDALIKYVLMRDLKFSALGIDPMRAFDGLGLEEQPILVQHILQRLAVLRPVTVPPVSTKERWVCQTLLSQRLDVRTSGEKVVIFSNYRESLKHLGALLDERIRYGVPGARGYVFVDGECSDAERKAARKQFRDDPACTVMLATIGVNSLGLDLTCANHVVLYDPWWNPNPELQAAGRVRGQLQTRQVYVYRLIIRDTIDEWVAEEANKKLHLDKRVLPQTVVVSSSATEPMVDDPIAVNYDARIPESVSSRRVMERLFSVVDESLSHHHHPPRRRQ